MVVPSLNATDFLGLRSFDSAVIVAYIRVDQSVQKVATQAFLVLQ